MDQTSSLAYTPWWGEYKLDSGETGRWQVGPLTVTLQRLASEWQLRYRRNAVATIQSSGNTALAANLSRVGSEDQDGAEVRMGAEPLDETASCHRHVVKLTKSPLLVMPALADRPVVSRPVTPFHLSPGQEVRLFVGTMVWFQVYAYKSGPLLLDIPVQRPSDTWFGPSTREGEIAYAARTHARLELDELPMRAFRANTPVKIVNKGEQALLLERLMLPIPQLSLYAANSGRLWTEELSIVCDEEMASAHLRLRKGAPSQAEGAVRLAGPRSSPEKGVLVRALGAIFG